MSDEAAFQFVRRVLNDESALIQRLRTNVEQTLLDEGFQDENLRIELARVVNLLFVGAAQQNSAAQLLTKSLEDTLAVASQMKNSLRNTVDQIDDAFRSTMIMYQVSFYLGVALVIASVVAAALTKQTLLPVVFGAMGVADVMTFFLAKPQEKLQSSRASLAQLQAALFTWFSDAVNQNGYLMSLSQQGKLDEATMARLSKTLMLHTEQTLAMLQKYCKLVEDVAASPDGKAVA
jgi:hypothetical protein